MEGEFWYLVVHDGTETHDAEVDVVLLLDDPRAPLGFPASDIRCSHVWLSELVTSHKHIH